MKNFEDYFLYTHAMNERCIDAVSRHEEAMPDRIHALLCHILNAHHIWNARIDGSEPEYQPWEPHLPETYPDLNNAALLRTRVILESDDPIRTVRYANTVGQTFTSSVGDILFHVVNHGTHHRAQIASLLRAAGFSPPSMDWIAYKRR